MPKHMVIGDLLNLSLKVDDFYSTHCKAFLPVVITQRESGSGKYVLLQLFMRYILGALFSRIAFVLLAIIKPGHISGIT